MLNRETSSISHYMKNGFFIEDFFSKCKHRFTHIYKIFSHIFHRFTVIYKRFKLT